MNGGEKKMTEQDSLAIIHQMINAAKQDQKDNGLGWIIWGWLLFLSSLMTLANLQFKWFDTFFFWNVFGLFAVLLLVASVVRNLVVRRVRKVRTYMMDVFEKLNIGFTITLLLIILAMNVKISATAGFALLTALYGFWVMIYGALLNFKPSSIAAYVLFALALASLFVPTLQWVMALHALAAFTGYIVPGHLAYIGFKKISAANNNKKERSV